MPRSTRSPRARAPLAPLTKVQLLGMTARLIVGSVGSAAISCASLLGHGPLRGLSHSGGPIMDLPKPAVIKGRILINGAVRSGT